MHFHGKIQLGLECETYFSLKKFVSALASGFKETGLDEADLKAHEILGVMA